MNNDKNEILVTLNDTYAESKSLEEKSQIIEQQMIELERFKEVLNDLEKTHDEEILAQIGKGVYAKSKLIDDKFFIEVGAGVFVRKDLEETKEVVEEQMKRLGEMRIEIGIESEDINEKLRDLIEAYEG